MSAMIPFSFDGAEVRVSDQAGEPWFVAADICNALGISNSRDAIGKLDADEKGVALTDTLGGRQEMTVVNESGMYALILRCRDAMTEGTIPHRFRKWITSEVIPAIRKTGSYGRDPMVALSDPESLRDLLLTYSEKVLTLEAENRELAPKAEALDLLEASEGSVNVRIAAKLLDMPERKFTSWLQSNRWAFRQNGIGPLQAYADKRDRHYLEHRPHTYYDRTRDEERTVAQMVITPKGLTRLAKLLRPTTGAK